MDDDDSATGLDETDAGGLPAGSYTGQADQLHENQTYIKLN
jgi:hypothetical protein